MLDTRKRIVVVTDNGVLGLEISKEADLHGYSAIITKDISYVISISKNDAVDAMVLDCVYLKNYTDSINELSTKFNKPLILIDEGDEKNNIGNVVASLSKPVLASEIFKTIR